MNTEDWKSIGLKVAKAAPLIGGLLGGPVGTVVGTVGNMVASALDTAPEPSEVAKALANDPDAYIKIKELENQNIANFREMAFQQTKLEVIDRVNARKTHNGHWMTVVLPMTMLAYLFFTTYALLTYIVPVDSKEMLYNILSQMLTMTIGAVGYWTGTTRGSTEKNFLLGNK